MFDKEIQSFSMKTDIDPDELKQMNIKKIVLPPNCSDVKWYEGLEMEVECWNSDIIMHLDDYFQFD